jgi:hypothetical protein
MARSDSAACRAPLDPIYPSGMRISEALSLPSDAARVGTKMLLVRGELHRQHCHRTHGRLTDLGESGDLFGMLLRAAVK